MRTLQYSGHLLLALLLSTILSTITNCLEFEDIVSVDNNEGVTANNVVNKNSNTNPQDEALKRPERLTVIAPKFLRPQSDYHVLINLANTDTPTQIDLQLTGARDSNQEQGEAKSLLISAPGQNTQTIKFSIGNWPAAEYILNVTAEAIDRSWSWTQEAAISYQAKSYSALVQTDKAIYKPGQLVQFRVLFLTQTLTPLSLKDEINVTISDPKKNFIKQWSSLSTYRGLLSLEMQLTEDPMLGDYQIKVEARNQETTKNFKVAEYILPTFDVNIQLPSYVTYNESDLTASVLATYTYGKPVNGHVALTVQPLVRFSNLDTRPLQQSQYRARLVNGTADINLDLVKDLRLDRELFEREIEFFALVEEDLTGRKYNKTKTIKIHDGNIKIERLNKRDRFRPGLSQVIQLKVAYQDDTPVEDNGPELELVATLAGKPFETVKLRPVNGLVEHSFDIPSKIKLNDDVGDDTQVMPTFMDLKANYRGHIHYLSSLTALNSESEQFMQISLPQLHQSTGGSSSSSSSSPRSTRLRASKKTSPTKPSIHVDDDLRVKIKATEGMQQVTCQGIAKGDIIWALSPDAKNKTEFEFEVKVDQRMAPEGRILCFYVRPENKELIADSIEVPVSGMIRNLIKLTSSRDEAKPGQEVEVGVLTKPNSLVGVLGIDQSVLLLQSGNDITQQDVEREMKSYGTSSSVGDSYGATRVSELIDEADMIVMTNNKIYDGFGSSIGRLSSDGMVYVKMAYSSPASSKNIALDSLFLEHEITPPEFHLSKQKREPLVIRTLFPETWLWENGTSGSDGVAKFSSKIPDTITSWVLSAFSINEAQGLALTNEPTKIRVFRPFFIKLNLPYSIIRGETVSIQGVVFNYGKRATQARVTLENRNGEFEFVEAANSIDDERRSTSGSQSKLIRIPAEDATSVSFLIKPLKLGNIDIRMLAQGEFAGDGLVKKLLVKPEGQTQYLNKAMLLNLEGPQSTLIRNLTVDVPPNAVANSSKVFVSAVGDILGPGLSNVDDLLRLPYGCGEQNMINLVPNIVILNYLQKTRRLKEAQRVRAVRNIESGYQRQLNYKRLDGSFSAFGQSDKNGSVWLTAYVLKTLQQAKSAINIDERVIRRAANYLSSFSRPDGSIEESGMLHNKKLQSEAASGASTYLTAYTVIALLQRGIQPDGEAPAPVAIDEVIEKGLAHLEGQIDEAAGKESPYELAIITYALQLANRKPEAADRAYERLWSRANESGDLTWWSASSNSNSNSDVPNYRLRAPFGGVAPTAAKLRASEISEPGSVEEVERETLLIDTATSGADSKPIGSPQQQQPPLKPVPINPKHSAHSFIPDSLDIEMTSLALLSTVKRGELDRALPIVRWLIQKQNSNGGFASTQDTVLAIEALASFAEASASSKSPLSIDLEFAYPRTSGSRSGLRRNNVDQMLISQPNALVNQQIRLPDNITWVQMRATGAGAAVVQLSWQYNLLVSAEKPAFYLNPILDKNSNINYLQLSICTFYKGEGESSNMAVVEVELPSGYVADVEALPGLKQTKDIKRVDTSDGDTKVMVYLDRVTRDEICFTVPAHRTTKVANNRPVPVQIYDYYDRQQVARIFYEPPQASSCDICEPSECQETCARKPKKLERLRSLHEQRHELAHNNKQSHAPKRNADLKAANGPTSAATTNVSELLPLAPVMMTILSAARNVYNQHN